MSARAFVPPVTSSANEAHPTLGFDGRRPVWYNPVEVLEVSTDEAAAKVAGSSHLWAEIRRDGRVVYGLDLEKLQKPRSA